MLQNRLRRVLGAYWIGRIKLACFHLYNLVCYGQLEVFANICLETYSVCNRRCGFCPVGQQKRPPTLLPEELFRRVIDQLARRKYRGEIGFHFYNEPLLDKRLPDLIRYAHQQCPRSFLYLASNGDHLTLESFRKCLAAGLCEMRISQYEAEPSPGLAEFLAQAGDEDRRHFQLAIRGPQQAWSNRGGNVAHMQIAAPLQQRCSRPDLQLIVNAFGKVPLCCCDYQGSQEMGDVTRDNVFDIWRNPRFRAARRQLRRGRRAELELCKACDYPDESYRLPLPRIP